MAEIQMRAPVQTGGTLADYAEAAVGMKNRLSDPSTAHIVVVDVLDRNGTLVDRFMGLHVGTAIFNFSTGKNMTRAEVEEGGRLMAVWYLREGHKELEGLDEIVLNTPLMELRYNDLNAYARRVPPLETVVPTRVAEVEVPTETLAMDAHGEGVRKLQLMLNSLGMRDYEGKALETDSDFGRRTQSAVVNLQKMLNEAGITASNGSPLEVSGVFNFETQQAVEKYFILSRQASTELAEPHGDVTRFLREPPASRGGYVRSSLDIADMIHGEIQAMINSGDSAGLGMDSHGGLE